MVGAEWHTKNDLIAFIWHLNVFSLRVQAYISRVEVLGFACKEEKTVETMLLYTWFQVS